MPYAQFYLSENLNAFLDAFEKALLKRGLPRKLYTDNGSAFRSKHLEHTTASLGIGQLNTYVNWYRKNMMDESDNPPVGILLCTGKNHTLVEYALAGMDNQLFVSKYLLELPKKEEMQHFIEQQIKESAV